MKEEYRRKLNTHILSLLKFQENKDITEDEIMQFGIDNITELSDSKYGHLHLFNSNSNDIYLKSWSIRTSDKCVCLYDNHFPLNKSGIWGDSIRIKSPIIVNDYKNEPLKKELPDGHFELTNYISIPVLYDNEVVMLVGVANKDFDYSELDVENIQIFSDLIWGLLKNKKNEKKSKSDYFNVILSRKEFENEITNSLNTNNDNYKIIAYFNIINFRFISNIAGHQLSDEVLKSISQIIKNDLSNLDIVGKLYDNEICVLFNDFNIKKIESLCKQILIDIRENAFYFKNKLLEIVLNVGITYLNYNEYLTNILDKIDKFYYLFKKNKNKKILIYDDKNSIEYDKWFYDFIINVDKINYNFNKIENSNLNIIELNVEFYKEQLYYIKNKNLSLNLDQYFLNKILNMNSDDIDLIFIKISALSLLNEDFYKNLKNNNKICLEFEEDDFKENREAIIDRINNLRLSGNKFAIYNFQGNFNSFEFFKDSNIDFIKIDFEDLFFSEIYWKILNLAITVSKYFNINLIMNNIKTESMYNKIKELEIEYIQGSYIDRKYSLKYTPA